MKALILKDYRAYRLFYVLILIITLLYSYLNIRFGSVDGIIGFLVIMLPAISSVILYIGDHSLQYYISSLPNSRKTIVLSKYLNTYLFSAVLILISVSVMYVLSFWYPDAKTDFNELITLRGFLFLVTPITAIVSICYPLLFKFGLKLGVKIVMSLFAVLYGFGIVVIERLIRMTVPLYRGGIFYSVMTFLDYYEKSHSTIIYYYILVILIFMFLSSIFLSIRFYNQKDII